MRGSIALVAGTFVLTCFSAPTSNNVVLHEKRGENLHQWQKRSRAIPHQVLPIKIALRQQNLENAEEYIHDVADPDSPNFGKMAL
jgi:tripeptidyl-peptidase-1